MKLKHLDSYLSSVPNRVFPDPKISLEQYPTSAQLTASVVLMAVSKGDAGPGTTVLDLGCGTGMLGLGFALVESDAVYLVDCDREALSLARENVDYLVEEELIDGCTAVELIGAKVNYAGGGNKRGERGNVSMGGKGRKGRGNGRGRGRGRGNKSRGEPIQSQPPPPPPMLYDSIGSADCDDGIPLPSKVVDTVITNPPFGTKNNEGIDVQFLRTGIRLAKRAVYSFHKTSTRPFLIKLIREKWGLNVEVVAEMKFEIPNMYKFHKHKSVDVEVDLIRVFWEDDKNDGSEREELGEHVDSKSEGAADNDLGLG